MTRACLLLHITLALTVSCSAVQGECLASLPPLPPSTHDSACSNIRNAPDVCKRAQQLKACLHGKLSEECMTVPWFSHYIDTERCGSSSTMMTRITDMRSVFSTGFYMMCDPDGGVCPELWRCVEGVAAILRDAQPTDYDVICTLALYLDCFANASSTCRVDQGTVTFVQIRGVVDELCKEVLPQSTDVLDCPQVQQCVNETILSNFGTHDTGTGDQRWNYVYNWAHVTRTGFWCS
ncbi:hypothetical protein BaRGS_00035226 [Batillaria attramentaria]|uniref:Uncharacterized protein n=1 Tax=Batillaria attramentaria TaxID=370345 RepID=A0ABD0JFA8_9CAEN